MRGLVLAAFVTVLLSQPAAADAPAMSAPLSLSSEYTRSETLWIFDADFEDLAGDNAGWTSYDRTGTLAVPNHWHKDTIRIHGFTHLGDSTWWCGKYDPCWRQPRGYGNDWVDILVRDFPEVAANTDPGDTLILEYDQRYAMEQDYDYGYTEVSSDGGATWTTLYQISNPGFANAGMSQDWDSVFFWGPGHMSLDLSAYAGLEISIRFRFESDGAYSSQDQYNNPPLNSVKDGAWQIDNIALYDTHPSRTEPFWFDDCESPGDNGWVHDEVPASGQVGVVFERRFESFGGHTGWMMAAYDTTSGGMIDGQSSLLQSPPIDVSGAPSLIGRWEGWFDLTASNDDIVSLWLSVSDIPECLQYHGGFEPIWGWTYGGPYWIDVEQEWGAFAGEEWLGLTFAQANSDPAVSHGVGFVLDRVRVGVPLETGVPDADATRVTLGRPHPSPFSAQTRIAYTIPSGGHATIRIVDVAGRVVRTLLDRPVEPGEYSLSWDGTADAGTRAASGVYFVRLEFAGGGRAGSATRKLILID